MWLDPFEEGGTPCIKVFTRLDLKSSLTRSVR